MKKRLLLLVLAGMSAAQTSFAILPADRALQLPHTGEMKLSEMNGRMSDCVTRVKAGLSTDIAFESDRPEKPARHNGSSAL